MRKVVFCSIFFFVSLAFSREYIVGFEKNQMKNIEGVRTVKTLKNLEMAIVDVQSMNELKKIKNVEGVKFVEASRSFLAPKKVSKEKLPVYSNLQKGLVEYPWGILEVDAPAAWSMANGQGVKVLVLDTGIDKNHPNIYSRFVEGRNLMSTGAGPLNEDNSYDYFDNNGHGTHVSGTILADGFGTGVVGVAPGANLYMGKVCEVYCNSSAILAGVEWAIEAKVHVVNMSLGGPFPSSAAEQVYNKAEENNVVIVAASGNDGRNKMSYPAKYKSVFSVGAIDSDLKVADFSNYDADLDAVAPGVDVRSSVPQGTGREAFAQFADSAGREFLIDVLPVDGAMVAAIEGTSVEYIGLGKKEDVEGKDLTGKIALIQRGEIAFSEKAENALSVNASGVIIFNNVEGSLPATFNKDIAIVAVTMGQADGENILASLQAEEPVSVTSNLAVRASDYNSLQGTSMASPHVAGVAALVRSANPDLDAQQVKEILKTSALKPMFDNSDNKYGSGIVNAFSAVKKAQENQ